MFLRQNGQGQVTAWVSRGVRSVLRFFGFLVAGAVASGEAPRILPERTEWQETTRSAEVIEHLQWAADSHPRMHLTHFGYSLKGQRLPLLVIGPERAEDASAAAVASTDVLRIYLKANIHAGEVAGKEALLRLVREWVQGSRPEWMQDWILLVGPNFNPDGNDTIGLSNRILQLGPIGGMGTRENAQGLDLNRDMMKLDAPESRAFTRLMTDWDPHVVVDLHTTNGTEHAYHLTYAPGLHPATPEAVDRFLRDELFPDVTARMEERWGWHTWHYGNVMERNGLEGWWTFDARPRFVTNYVGLRGRLAVLSEAYCYLDFRDRVLASERFVESLLEVLHENRSAVKALVEATAASARADLVGQSMPLRGQLPASPPQATILMGGVDSETHPYTGHPLLRRNDRLVAVDMPAGIAFEPAHPVQVPQSYVLRADAQIVVELLKAHGLELQAIEPGSTFEASAWIVESSSTADRPFQGRHEQRVQGSWGSVETVTFDDGGFRLCLHQDLARLAVLLLEPTSDDGLLNWGFWSDWLGVGKTLPVYRVPVE